jgi:uncharacterized protein (TIGR03437 family)
MVSALSIRGNSFATKIDAQLTHILFSTRLGTVGGGPTYDNAAAVTSDSAGDIYIAGTTAAGFATTSGVLQPQAPATTDLQNTPIEHGFLMEISSAGDRVVYSTYFSGASFICATKSDPCAVFQPPFSINPAIVLTTPTAIAVDAAGTVTLGGYTNSTGIPVTSGSYATQCGCTNLNSAAFVARIAPGATKLVWGTYIPVAGSVYAPIILGVPLDTVASLALDASGNVVIAGQAAKGFPVPAGALQDTFPSASGANWAGYVAKLDSSGSRLLFSTWLGGQPARSLIGPSAVGIDSAGTIWLTGGAAVNTLPSFDAMPVLGENYIAGLSSDGSSLLSLVTTPNNASGAALQVTSTVNALGSAGMLSISSPTAGPSLLGIAVSPAYSAANAVSPRELISLYGIGIGPAAPQTALTPNNKIPTSISGVQVLFDGVPAPLIYAGASQINTIVPAAVSDRATTTISIVTPAGSIAGPTLPVVATQPVVFESTLGWAMAVNQDATLNSPVNPAAPGSIVAIWLTGGGAQDYTPDNLINSQPLRQNPYPVSVLTTNTSVPFPTLTSIEVLYAGDAPDLPSGVIQVNFLLPPWAGEQYQVQIGAASASFNLNVSR